jgi:hypothetical protein
MATNFSKEQVNVFNFIENSLRNIFFRRIAGANLVVKAFAGTGKTFTMVSECVRLQKVFPFIKKWDVCFMAFNKSISTETNDKPIEWQKVDSNGWTMDEDGLVRLNGIPQDNHYVDEEGYVHHTYVDEETGEDKDDKIPSKWMHDIADVFTTHAFGMRCINRYLRFTNAGFSIDEKCIDENDEKYIKIAKSLLPADITKTERNEKAKTISKIFNMCRINLIKAGDIVAMRKIITHYDMMASDDEIAVANTMMSNYAYNANILENPRITYTDMLIYPLVLHKKFAQNRPAGFEKKDVIPYYRVVFCDECQDLNNAQRHLMSIAARKGMFVAVGDPFQAINGFAGANNDSFDKIAALPNTYVLPLSVNYRCGKNIINKAQGIVPDIQAHEGAIDGCVNYINNINVDTFQEGHTEQVVDEKTGEVKNVYIDGDMILARCTAPLVSLCIKLIAQGKAAQVMGKDIVKSIESLVKRSEAKTIKGFRTWVEDEKVRLVKEIMKQRDCNQGDAMQTATYVTFCDKVDCIMAFADRESNLEYILAELNAIFTKKRAKGAITFCTCHKSKGLENDRVFILTPERLPMEWKDQLEWQYQQEVNLEYVAYTRAKKELVIVNIEQKALMSLKFGNKK